MTRYLAFLLALPMLAIGAPKLLLHDFIHGPTPIPQWLATNKAFMEATPFDGLVVYMRKPDLSMNMTALVMTNTPTSYVDITSVLAPISGLGFTHLTENMAFVIANKPTDFFNDWSIPIQNFANLAQAIKDAGLKGIFFDNEQYNPWGCYPACVDFAGTHTLAQYQAQATLRGKQIMQAMIAQFPGIVIITLHGPETSEPTSPAVGSTSGNNAMYFSSNELLGPFFVGFMEGAAGTAATVVDGGELYCLRTPADFQTVYTWDKNTLPSVASFIPAPDRAGWPSEISIGYGLYDALNCSGTGGLTTPAIMQQIVTNALNQADKYAWLYTENTTFLLPPGSGGASNVMVAAVAAGQAAAAQVHIAPVTFTDQSGVTQTNRPFSIPREFKCGDIPNYPRPVINGTPAATWQSDIQTRWTSPTLCADGSAKQSVVSVLATVPAFGTITIDFQNSSIPCSSGNQAACDAAALTIVQLQALSWNVQIEATASSITKTFNARTILNACGAISTNAASLGCRYWLRGPVRTSVIFEDRDTARAYDAGWTCSANCTAPYASATWVSDTTNKSLHPMFNVDFWNGTTNIQYRAVALENMWTTHRQDQAYALTIKTGNALTHVAYSQPYFVHYNDTRWREGGDPTSVVINAADTFWDSTTPGVVRPDLNFSYLISTGAVPNYDTTKTPSSTGDNSVFAASTGCGPNGHGLFDQNMGDTGGRPELGIIPGWYVRTLYTMDAVALRTMELMGDCQGSVQVNVRESGTGLFYDSGHTVNAFGRTFSVDAHPTGNIGDILFPPVGPAFFTPVFAFNLAHQPNFNYGPYLASGDWYTYESMLLQASNDIQITDPTTQPYGRNGAMGLINGRAQQLRGQAWGWRDLTETTSVAVDGSPEAAYLQQKLANNFGAWEGWFNITNGTYNGSPAWLFGRNIEAAPYEPNPLRYQQYPDCCAGSLGWLQPTVQLMESPLEMHFLTVATGHGVELGYPFQKLQQVDAALPLNMVLNPLYNPYLIGAYRVAEFFNSNPNHFATTFPQVLAGYSTSPTNYQTINTWPVQDQTDCTAGFTHYSLAALSFLANVTLLPVDGGYNGANSWAWVSNPAQGIINATCLNANPMWAFLPRGVAPPVAPTITTACPLPAATLTVPYSQQATATGTALISWDLSAGAFPTGISMNANGLISGAPTSSGTSFTLRATNVVGNDTKACSIVVNTAPVAPVITTSSPLPGGTVGTVYATTLAATGTTPLAWIVLSGTLPPGLNLNGSSGAIGGTPTTTGVFSFTVQVSNTVSTNSKLFSLTVSGATTAPTITTTCPLPSIQAGLPYSQQATATGTTPISWDLSAGTLPFGIAISSTGLIAGTPPNPGTSTFTLRATNIVNNNTLPCSLVVTSPPPPSLNYTISGTGPHHVVVGHYMFFNIVGTLLSGTNEAAFTSVAGLPANTTAVFVNQVKVGGCCGPTTPGVANSLNPVQITAGAGVAPGTYPLTITYISTPSGVTKTAPYTLFIDPVPGALPTIPFPPDVPLAQLAQYNTNMTTSGTVFCTPPLGGPALESGVWYYDGTRVMYQIADYTANPSTWNPCAQALDTLYRTYVTNNSGNIPGYHVFPRGLQLGFSRDGVAGDKTAIQLMQTNGYACPANIALTIDWLLSREITFGLETNLEANVVGLAPCPPAQDVIEVLLGHFDQWFLSQSAGYTQPFMVGLATEALIQYYDATGDVRVPPMLKLAADQLWTKSFDPLSNSLLYYNYNASLGPPPPPGSYPYSAGCSNQPSFSINCSGPAPDLNLLTAPLYGWVYQHTGQQVYRDHGDLLFNTGVTSGCPSCDGKHFSQTYRWSMKYLVWRIGTPVPPPIGSCDLNSDTRVNVLDVQLSANMTLGIVPCTANINGPNVCNVVTIQRVVNATLGGACVLGP